MEIVSPNQRFLIVSIVPKNVSEKQLFNQVKETISLIETYGGVVIDIVLQKREIHDKGMYVGRGKIDEITKVIVFKNIDVVVLNAVIKPGQIYDFQTIFEKSKLRIQVWDRIDLILKIFSKNAYTVEAKLQIELAAMQHMGPRIYGMGAELSRQGGIIGTRGIGETNTERMKRHWGEQIKKVRNDLRKLANNRQKQITKRKEFGLKTVSLVGYTNVGKTSLFNILTNKKKRVKNALFVTLDSNVGKLYLSKTDQEVLISDTIGFIRDLPPQLVEAFRSTLMESLFSNLLLHIIDVSDDEMDYKINVVESILDKLNTSSKRMIFVFNKADLINPPNIEKLSIKFKKYSPVFVSTRSGKGITSLIELIFLRLISNNS